MTTTGTQRIEFSPKRYILGNMTNVWCLCPPWMCWMPWLKDGDEVRRVSGKIIERNMISSHYKASLKGL